MSEGFTNRLPTFFDLFSRGRISADRIDDYVDAWHDAHETWAGRVSLHEYLGLTWPEYQVWVCDADALPAIMEARVSGRPLIAVIAERVESMRAAGRPTDGTTIFTLGNWLKQSASDASRRSQALG